MLIAQGLQRLAQFDAKGFLFFDASPRGFWRSFLAAVMCLPIWGLAVAEEIGPRDGGALVHFVLVQFAAYIISWLAYPLLMVRLSRMFGLWPAYYRYMVSYNWVTLLLQSMSLPLLLINLLPGAPLPSDLLALLWLLIQSAAFAYDWFMARAGLGAEPATAAALALIDFLLGLLIDQVAGMMA